MRQIYIGETGRPMEERMKEQERDIRLARTQTSAVSGHANETVSSKQLLDRAVDLTSR